MTLMPEFRRQLLDAAADHPGERRRRRFGPGRTRRGLAWRTRLAALSAPMAVTASILVVVAVVTLALPLGTARRGARTPSAREVPNVATARAQLLGELSVLRRGDPTRLAAHPPLPPSVPGTQIDRSLVRTVRTRGYAVTLIPVSEPVRVSGASRRTTNLVVEVRGPDVPSGFPAIGSNSFAVADPVSPATIARHGTIIVMYVSGPLNRAVIIVPDGVTRVQLSRFTPDRGGAGGPAAIPPAAAAVHDNVAVIPLPGITPGSLHQTLRTVQGHGGLYSSHRCRVTAALWFVPVTARMTWQRTTAAGSQVSSETTVHTSLNAYSRTVLPTAPRCRHSPRG